MEDKNISCPSNLGVILLRIINIGRKKYVANITMMNTAIMIKIKTWTVFMTRL
jgi:hypothetical protein